MVLQLFPRFQRVCGLLDCRVELFKDAVVLVCELVAGGGGGSGSGSGGGGSGGGGGGGSGGTSRGGEGGGDGGGLTCW